MGRDHLRKPRLQWKENAAICSAVIGNAGVGWIPRSQDKDLWWAFVNTVMIRCQDFVEYLMDFKKWLCSVS
jgi:hypothetical protein